MKKNIFALAVLATALVSINVFAADDGDEAHGDRLVDVILCNAVDSAGAVAIMENPWAWTKVISLRNTEKATDEYYSTQVDRTQPLISTPGFDSNNRVATYSNSELELNMVVGDAKGNIIVGPGELILKGGFAPTKLNCKRLRAEM